MKIKNSLMKIYKIGLIMMLLFTSFPTYSYYWDHNKSGIENYNAMEREDMRREEIESRQLMIQRMEDLENKITDLEWELNRNDF
jgi:hypothetical protein